jgi:hypothetical protein
MSLASSKALSIRRQRGITLLGMVFWAVIIGGGTLLVLKSYPSFQKYYTTRQCVDRLVRADPRLNSVPAIRSAFNKQRDIEYIQDMIKGEDLIVEAVDGGFDVSFAFDDEVALVGPVFMLFKWRYSASIK